MKKTITREYLANCIKQELGLSRADSLKLVSLILNNISNSIKKDKLLKLPNLGTFKIRNKNSRMEGIQKQVKNQLLLLDL